MHTAIVAFGHDAIARVIIDQLGAQVGLATTLATAIAGGLVALVIQLAIHNHSGHPPVALRGRLVVALALALEVASLLLGYFARSAVTDLTPVMMRLPPSAWTKAHDGGMVVRRFAEVAFNGSDQLAWLVGSQFLFMFGGILAAAIVAGLNLRVLLEV